MLLPSPVTLTRISGESVTISNLSLIFHDHNDRRVVVAILRPHCSSLVLWEGDEYDSVGDWTQAQAEARILELLGDDIAAGLQAMVVN